MVKEVTQSNISTSATFYFPMTLDYHFLASKKYMLTRINKFNPKLQYESSFVYFVYQKNKERVCNYKQD